MPIQVLQLSAWAKERVNHNAALGSEYKNLVKGLGAMIIQNGLLGTIVFLRVKAADRKPHRAVIEDIQAFLNNEGYRVDLFGDISFRDEEYLQITTRVLEMVKWLRRYVDILIQGEE
ncbi:MAG TPA: type III-B CRISPR module-associated protein Cmr5 [Thermotogota bacterium]|nr:type III-B CRISPR module-associated protein Cmr5 [Thermotogota bacterium]HRW93358.1 type III-B CRISPR module-associated protein Cmr5 [Thermotogota bacterium]